MKTGYKRHGKKRRWLWGIPLVLGCMFAAALMSATMGAEQPRIVYVYSDSCGYCTTFAPKFDEAVKSITDWKVDRLDINNPKELDEAEKLGAEVTPTVFIVKDGQVVDKLEGDVSGEVLDRFVRNRMGVNGYR
ncbi:thioredoxin family protein [Brevibacillus borstelensis]|uniref:thioredoxin family protein n=1 Tax=Brevibacillus borstelensis TaxID=45462 RepID=UPI0030BB6206